VTHPERTQPQQALPGRTGFDADNPPELRFDGEKAAPGRALVRRRRYPRTTSREGPPYHCAPPGLL